MSSENIVVTFEGPPTEPHQRRSSDEAEKKSLLESAKIQKKTKKDSRTIKERTDDFISQFYNSEYRELFSKDAMAWLKLSAFYCVFYLWLAAFFCFMLFMFWVIRIRGQSLPVYYNTESVMNYKVVNPGLGFRPQLDPESDLIHIRSTEAESNIKSLENFLEKYEKNKDSEFVNGHNEKVKFNYEEITKDTPCSKDNRYGLGSISPCVVVKLNRIIDWLPKAAELDQFPAGLNETVKSLEANDKIENQKYVYVACSGQNSVDRDNIKEIEYYSSHFSNQIGGINFKYFPYINQPNYLSPLIFVHFKDVSSNTLINVVCKAYAGNIDNIDTLNQRGMVKFSLFIE